MSRLYCVRTIIANQAVASTEDCYVEINVPANVTIRIKRIHIDDNSGQTTTFSDLPLKVRFLETSTTCASGAAFTPIKRNANTASPSCTAKIRSLGTQVTTPGTLVREFDRLSIRAIHEFEWFALDAQDAMTLRGPNSFFEVTMSQPDAIARQKHVSVWWEEF